jgi:aspartate dehydrogenase
MVIATGAYGDPKLWEKHKAAAAKSGARLRLPSGAIAGLDGLLAMRLGKLERVKYTSIKPPHAWSGTPAETDFDLPSIKVPTVIFQGSPADAGRLYPKNANLAVTVALCGAGLNHTDIELVADPTLPAGTNASRLEVVSDSGELRLERVGKAMPDNPKTGVLTALTMADDLMKMVRASDW